MSTIHYQNYPTTVSSVDNLPDEIPTDQLEEFKIQVGRSSFVEISNEVARNHGFEFHSSLDDEEVIRSYRTENFLVELIAGHPRYIELNWLYTDAEIKDGELQINSSARYGESAVEEMGQEELVRCINEDRRELGRIAEAYCSFRRQPKVFDARVDVSREKLGVIGSRSLHGCIYDSHEELFFGDGYGEELISEAIAEARSTIADIKQDFCTS
jgi:hypothetical protein